MSDAELVSRHLHPTDDLSSFSSDEPSLDEWLRRSAQHAEAEPVKTFETKSQDFFCRSLWTVGLLIQATVG
ncbi:MAG: hypothetical protein ACYDH5_13610, partial [Acidimicrobiales bacterium]